MKQRAIAVIRVSSEEQAAEGRAGMDRQRADVIWTAQHYNLDIVRTVELEGVSGTTVMADRRFRAVMHDISDPGIAGVVCSALDRLVRPEGYDFGVLQQFWNTRKLILTPSGPMDPSSTQGQLLVGIQGLM